MDIEISPEPSDEERRAILAALALEREELAGRTLSRFGRPEPDEEDDEGYTTAPRRRS